MPLSRSALTRRRLLAGAATAGGVAVVGAITAGPTPAFEASAPERGSWPMPRFGPRNAAANPHASPPRTTPEAAWEASVPGAKALVVADGTVFAGSDGRARDTDQGVVALDAVTGERRWRSPAGAASLCVHDGTVYGVSGDTAVVTALDAATGERRWRAETGTMAGHFVLPGESALYVGLHGWVDAREYGSGALRWRRTLGGLGRVGVGVAHERLYVGGPGPTRAFEPREGPGALVASGPALGWRERTPSDFGFAPAVTDEHVLVGGRNGTDPSQTVTAHDPATGAVEWTAPPLGDVASTPAVAGNRGYVGAGTWDGDGARGGGRWSRSTSGAARSRGGTRWSSGRVRPSSRARRSSPGRTPTPPVRWSRWTRPMGRCCGRRHSTGPTRRWRRRGRRSSSGRSMGRCPHSGSHEGLGYVPGRRRRDPGPGDDTSAVREVRLSYPSSDVGWVYPEMNRRTLLKTVGTTSVLGIAVGTAAADDEVTTSGCNFVCCEDCRIAYCPDGCECDRHCEQTLK